MLVVARVLKDKIHWGAGSTAVSTLVCKWRRFEYTAYSNTVGENEATERTVSLIILSLTPLCTRSIYL